MEATCATTHATPRIHGFLFINDGLYLQHGHLLTDIKVHTPLCVEASIDQPLRRRADVPKVSMRCKTQQETSNFNSLIRIGEELRVGEKRMQHSQVGVSEL